MRTGNRRRAASSREYGMTAESTATAMASSTIRGASNSAPGPAMPNAVSSLVAGGFGVCLMPRIVPLPQLAVTRLPLLGTPVPARRFLTAVRHGSAEHPLAAAGPRPLDEAAAAHRTIGAGVREE